MIGGVVLAVDVGGLFNRGFHVDTVVNRPRGSCADGLGVGVNIALWCVECVVCCCGGGVM